MGSQPQRLQKIRRTSLIFHKLITMLMVLLPTTVLLMWAFVDLKTLELGWSEAEIGPLTVFERIAAAALSTLPLSITLIALFNLRRLFGLYAQGNIFETANVRCFRNMGWALILIMPANVLFHSALSVLLSFDQMAGERMLAIGISSDDVGVAVVGGVIVIISWVMAEAADLSRDNAAIV